MRTNGYLQIQQLNKPNFGAHGVPVKDTSVLQWGNSIPCFIKTNTRNNKGVYQDGNFVVAKYEILIEYADTVATRISLIRDGKSLGEFAVQDIQMLSNGRTKIIV